MISAALLHKDLLRLGVGKAGGSKLPQDTPTTETFKGKGLEDRIPLNRFTSSKMHFEMNHAR